MEVYVAVSRCLRRADYELIVYELGAELARQHVRYAEVTFSPSTHELHLDVPHGTSFPAASRAPGAGQAGLRVDLAWVFDIVRATPSSPPTRTT